MLPAKRLSSIGGDHVMWGVLLRKDTGPLGHPGSWGRFGEILMID